MPEQVWDGRDLPEKELFLGRPSGSAMPLVWAHSEHIKLLRSLKDGTVFDMPPQGVERYIKNKTGSGLRIWRFNNRLSSIPLGKTLRIETEARLWCIGAQTTGRLFQMHDGAVRAVNYYVDLPLGHATEETTVVFTFYWPDAGHWENTNFAVRVINESNASNTR